MLPIWRVRPCGCCQLRFPLITIRQQLLLVVKELFAGLCSILGVRCYSSHQLQPNIICRKSADLHSTIASTGQLSWQKPQYIHFVMSMSYLVVLLLPSSRSSASIVMAEAGHIASHSLQAMQRSSPVGYLRNACSPRKRGPIGPFSKG